MHGIVLRLHDERRRRLLRRMDVRIRREILFRNREIARINNHRKIGPATKLIGRIDRIVKTLIKMSAERRCKMPSC